MSYMLRCGNVEEPCGFGLGVLTAPSSSDRTSPEWAAFSKLMLGQGYTLDDVNNMYPGRVLKTEQDVLDAAAVAAIENARYHGNYAGSANADGRFQVYGWKGTGFDPGYAYQVQQGARTGNISSDGTWNPSPTVQYGVIGMPIIPPVNLPHTPVVMQQPIVTSPTHSPATGTVQMPPGTADASVAPPLGFDLSAIPWWGWVGAAGAAYFAFEGQRGR